MTTTSTLATRLAAASIAVGALATDKRNAQQGYDYISADKILERCGDALAHAGVMVIPAITAEDTAAVEVTTLRGTGVRYDADVTFAMTLTDGETTLEFPWRGRGSDYAVPDKALYKAITSGHKYFLMKLLNVGVGNEDGEHEAAEPATKPATGTAKPAAQPPTRPAAAPRPAPPVQPSDGADNPSVEPPTDEENSIMGEWRGVMDAQNWSVQAGYCDNEHNARAAWVNVVKACGGYSPKNAAIVYLAFLRDRMAKQPA